MSDLVFSYSMDYKYYDVATYKNLGNFKFCLVHGTSVDNNYCFYNVPNC